jgi:hypothetical protein
VKQYALSVESVQSLTQMHFHFHNE